MKSLKNKKILFLCTANSARSQMAEALLRHKAGDIFNVFSAGTKPDAVDVRAIDALEKFGLDTNDLVSKSVNVFEGQVFDYVITLCDKANNECRSYPNAVKQLAWDFPDPKERSGSNPFSTTLNELNNRLSMFILVEEKDAKISCGDTKTSIDVKSDEFDPISFYKSLTDDIRLKTLMLTHYHGELCVCELMEAMEEDSQPKVSRNLAVLKKAKVITDRKHGQWVFYRINPDLPLWAKSVIAQTTENNVPLVSNELQRLANMQNRPNRANFCK
ncbi:MULTISPECIES: metalloregulator ArsR/SmtB family transcription factor [Alteromonadales]|jgi:ArsR family transcriptional regulator|uniref:metalloregulator ArsR/SmtB family transcription factor n=2 Tax=Gammaproteobacteria TaxID=1236 RepID=UPI0002319228|nr:MULTISPECIES: metalloregulator ArsR/SmtB family transcription factor [Alteromonadales]KXJ53324.1 MAG: ArsR family transcriptional regulator [Colwellia sp. Phe_37]MBL1386320.1 metalloregulator ArsR/SmtB family transcription factor [Colwellia sp.]TMP50721.1 ArsR family transcriptional regulator [Pseudoalteromonas sp. S1688]TMS80796.1 ArsR family transcriptional regulator [Pseudoalteromonas sp. S554]TMS91603.1 ArsR family transcriptional regulator [Pseudoalteromonas sp. S201]|tara:strand:+ start:1228 stop:2046 length:819 start_codon:yes stop_codon:yes gene_type:complete